MRSQDASVNWKRNILSDFNGRNPHWLMSESPLIDGAKIIVTPGGRGAGIVALDKTSGKKSGAHRSSVTLRAMPLASC